MRRAQSMGINLVIVAAIALLVLIIIALIVARGGQDLGKGTQSCLAQGGRCYDYGSVPAGWEPVPDSQDACPELQTCARYDYG